MKLSDYAKKNSLNYRTAWIHFRKGLIPNARQLSTGTIIVDEKTQDTRQDYTVIYARVNSSEKRSHLKSQIEKLSLFCAANGWVIKEVVKEYSSGLNDNRPKLEKILSERKATRIVVEHKHKLTRFGFNYIKILYPECDIIAINEADEQAEDKEELFEDFALLATSFCAKIYGKRNLKSKVEKFTKMLKELKDS